jgi:copper chaperone
MEKLILRVEGMSCGHCEIAVQDAVRRLSGIKKVKASKRKKECVAEYDAGQVSSAEIIQAINATGYTVVA